MLLWLLFTPFSIKLRTRASTFLRTIVAPDATYTPRTVTGRGTAARQQSLESRRTPTIVASNIHKSHSLAILGFTKSPRDVWSRERRKHFAEIFSVGSDLLALCPLQCCKWQVAGDPGMDVDYCVVPSSLIPQFQVKACVSLTPELLPFFFWRGCLSGGRKDPTSKTYSLKSSNNGANNVQFMAIKRVTVKTEAGALCSFVGEHATT